MQDDDIRAVDASIVDLLACGWRPAPIRLTVAVMADLLRRGPANLSDAEVLQQLVDARLEVDQRDEAKAHCQSLTRKPAAVRKDRRT